MSTDPLKKACGTCIYNAAKEASAQITEIAKTEKDPLRRALIILLAIIVVLVGGIVTCYFDPTLLNTYPREDNPPKIQNPVPAE